MSVSLLCEGAEKYFKVMHLGPIEQDTIRQTVSNYAWPGTCCQQICWVVYRVLQGVKSLCRASDWQVAKRIVSDRWMAVLIEEKLIALDKQEEMASYLYSRAADVLLECTLVAQEANALACPRLEKVIKKCDIINNERKKVKGYTVEEVD